MRLEEPQHRCLAPLSRERPSDRRTRSRNNNCLLDGPGTPVQTHANLSARQSEATNVEPRLTSRRRIGFIDERNHHGRLLVVPRELSTKDLFLDNNNNMPPNKLPPLPTSARSTVCSPRKDVRQPLKSRLHSFKPEDDPAFHIQQIKSQQRNTSEMYLSGGIRPRPPAIMPVERARMPSTAEEATRMEATCVEMNRSQHQTPCTPTRRPSRLLTTTTIKSEDVRPDEPSHESKVDGGQLERWVGMLVSPHTSTRSWSCP
jgi:hypothetical protein